MVRPFPPVGKLLPALSLLVAADLPAQTLNGRFLDAAVDSIVQEHLSSGQVAGLTVAVDRGGDLLHHQSYGHANVGLGVRTPLNAVYEIGSVTKQFTAVLTLLLVEDGLLDLEADISEYPPAFDTGGRAVPLERLLDHTSGIKGYTESPLFFGAIHTQALPPDTLLRLMEQEEWDFEPGEGLIYNNTGYFLMGRILEEVSGSSFAELLEERILGPLGMDDTHYCDAARVVEAKAQGYEAGDEGLTRAPYLDHRWPFAAGSMCSTARDLITWNRALHGGDVLSAQSYRSLITPEPLVDGSPVFYAKGLVHRKDEHGDVIRHGGGIFGFLTEVRYYPDEELTLVVVQNTAGPSGPEAVMEGVAALLLPSREPSAAEYQGELSLLAGTYAGPARGGVMEIEVRSDGSTLHARSNGGEDARLTHIDDGVFEGPDGMRVWFVGEDGAPLPIAAGVAPAGMRVDSGGYGLYPLVRLGG